MIGTLLFAATAGLAQAETTPAVPAAQQAARAGFSVVDGRQVYEPVYFARIAPQTAADMLSEIPGFTVRDSSEGRGLGQGGTNVLIGGQRVTGKETGPIDVLRRTPADNVIRIEVVDGASLGIPGLTGQVADVYLDRRGVSGNWAWRPTFRESLEPDLTNAAASVSGQLGAVTYTLGLENDSFAQGNAGVEVVTGPTGEVLATRADDFSSIGERPEVTLALGWNRENGHAANLNASYEVLIFDRVFRSDRPDLTDGAITRRDLRREEEWNAEASGDYALPALGGRLKLIGLQYLEHSPIERRLFDRGLADGFGLGGDFFDQTIGEGESILRAEQSWARDGGATVELAVEGAFNFLEAESLGGALDPSGEVVPGDPSSTVRVEELRGQASLAYARPLGPLDLSASLGVETAEISVPSSDAPPRTLTRPKGFASLATAVGQDTDLRLRVERKVGQLDFDDFVFSVDLTRDVETGGNPDIVPEQSWFLEGQVERRFGPQSQLTLRGFYEAITDRVDLVPLAGGGEGPGNVDSASVYGGSVVGTLALGWLGVPGALIDYEGSFRESELIDPFTGTARRFSDDDQWFWSVDFRQDVPGTPYGWGFGANDEQDAPSFRSDQVFAQIRNPYLYAFAEHRDVLGAQLRVEIGNLTDGVEGGVRTVFVPDSVRQDVLFAERRERTFGQILSVRLSDTF